MYIACPECDTKFVVTPEQIGKHGRKVKCSKCSHVWHQKLEDNIRIEPVLTVPEAVIPLGNGINLPALLPVKIPPYLFVMPVLMIGLIIAHSTMKCNYKSSGHLFECLYRSLKVEYFSRSVIQQIFNSSNILV